MVARESKLTQIIGQKVGHTPKKVRRFKKGKPFLSGALFHILTHLDFLNTL